MKHPLKHRNIFALVVSVFCSNIVHHGTAIHCFNCKADKLVDITKMDVSQIQAFLDASSCTFGKYSIGTNGKFICNSEATGSSNYVILVNDPVKDLNESTVSYNVTSKLLGKFPATTPSMVLTSKFSNTDHSVNGGECTWIRDHVDCNQSQSNDEDWGTICDCRRPKYRHGCSEAHRKTIGLAVLLLTYFSTFVVNN